MENEGEVKPLKCTLMHKNIEVADIEIDEAIGGITKDNELRRK